MKMIRSMAFPSQLLYSISILMHLVIIIHLLQLISWKLESKGMNVDAESYLIVHRFGTVSVWSVLFCLCALHPPLLCVHKCFAAQSPVPIACCEVCSFPSRFIV